MAFKLPKKFSPGFSTAEKPICQVELDSNNRYASSLTGVIISTPYGWYDVKNNTLTDSVESVLKANKRDFTPNQEDIFLHNDAYSLNSTDGNSVFFISKFNTFSNYSAIISMQQSVTRNGWEIRAGSDPDTSSVLMHRSNATNNFAQHVGVGLALSTDTWYRIAITIADENINTVPKYYVNRKKYNCVNSVGSGTGPIGTNSSNLYIGPREGGDTRLDGELELFLFFNRELTEIEALDITDNPYQVLKPSIDTIYFSDAVESTGGIDINVPKSDINLTSFQPVVNISQHITTEIPQHDLSLLSHVPSVSIGANIDVIAPQHDISINSYPPAVVTSNNISLDIPAHDINLLSYAPSIITSESIDLDIPLHSINIISYAPIAVASNFIDAEIPDHNININSHAPVISLGAIIENIIPAHNINITGYAPEVAISEHINSIIPEHDISLISYAPEALANSSVNAIIPKNDIQIESHIPRVLIAGAFTTAKERIYGYPAINRIYTMTRK